MSQMAKAKIENKIHAIAVYSGAHPAHQRLLASCCSRSIKMLGEWSAGKRVPSGKKLLSYISTAWQLRSSTDNAVVIEGTTPTILMAPVIKLFNCRKKSVIALCADDALYRAFIEKKFLSRLAIRFGLRYVSGIIAIGDLTARLAKTYLKSTSVEVRYPPISEDKINLLASLSPILDSHNLILIGGGSQYCKGVDIATKCLGLLRGEFPNAKLTVLGFDDLKEQPGIFSPGPVKDIRTYLSSASVLIHPVRGDAFPLVVVEAMLAGVVPFVSEWTGASSLVEKVSSKLVSPLEAEEFAKRITEFWSAPAEHRKALSDKCRRAAREFSVQAADQPSLLPFIESIAKLPFPKKRQNRSGKTH